MPTEQRRDGPFDRTGRLRPVVVERVGREAVAGAIARHEAEGRSIYYVDAEHPGFVVEERADGRRFLLAEDAEGRLETVRETPPR